MRGWAARVPLTRIYRQRRRHLGERRRGPPPPHPQKAHGARGCLRRRLRRVGERRSAPLASLPDGARSRSRSHPAACENQRTPFHAASHRQRQPEAAVRRDLNPTPWPDGSCRRAAAVRRLRQREGEGRGSARVVPLPAGGRPRARGGAAPADTRRAPYCVLRFRIPSCNVNNEVTFISFISSFRNGDSYRATGDLPRPTCVNYRRMPEVSFCSRVLV